MYLIKERGTIGYLSGVASIDHQTGKPDKNEK